MPIYRCLERSIFVNEYIEKAELIKKLCFETAEWCYSPTIKTIKDFPAADVQPIRHGRWTYPYKDKDINQCSECRSYVQDKISNVHEMFAYCPFCGARMDGDTNG